MFCKIWKAGALVCKKYLCSSTCSKFGIRWTTSWAKAKKLYYDIPWGTILICHWHNFNFLSELEKWFSVIGGIKGQKGNIRFHWLRLVKEGWYGNCLLENFKMINHQSSGLISSQKNKKYFWPKKAMMDIYGKRSSLNWFSVQKLAQCSQCVWISCSYTASVAQRVTHVFRDDQICCSLQVVSRAVWKQFSWFYVLLVKLHFCI